MSARIDHAIGVASSFYHRLFIECSLRDEVPKEEVPRLVREACQDLADKHHIKFNTVFAQVTTQLELSAEELYALMLDLVNTKDKGASKFADVLCYHSCDGDNNADIRQALRKIR